MADMLLEVKNLHTYFRTRSGTVKAVNDVSYSLEPGKTIGIVGESGSGKSVSAMSILRLLDANGYIDSGEIIFEGKDLTKLPMEDMYHIRGNAISVIFQEPMTSLNPVFTVKRQLSEPFMVHQGMNKKQAAEKSLEMLRAVQIPNPEAVLNQYPHQLSGGMRQRVMIAIALACEPKLLIADEPTTALDVTIQAQILDLMNELRESYDTSVIMITHDLGVIAETCEEVAVFYAGQVVEQASVEAIFHETAHPYSAGLLRSVTSLDGAQKELYTIRGAVPTAGNFAPGCRFADRCDRCMDVCQEKAPALCEIAPGHLCRCWLHAGGEDKGRGAAV